MRSALPNAYSRATHIAPPPTAMNIAPAHTSLLRAAGLIALLGLDVGRLDDLSPLRRLGDDELAELRLAHVVDVGALGHEALLHLRRGEDRGDLLVQPVDDRLRRAGGLADPPP